MERRDVASSPSLTSTKLGSEGSEQQETLSQYDIPYLPEEVVRRILGYLPVSDLTSCRLVNKTWNRAAVVALNRKMEICIQSAKCVTKYCETFANSIDGISLKVRSLYFNEQLFDEIVDRINDGAGGLVFFVLGLQKLAEVAGEQVKELTVNLTPELHKFVETSGTRNEVYAIICQILYVHYPEVEKLKLGLSFLYDYDRDTPRDGDEGVHEEIVMVGHALPKLNTLTISHVEYFGGVLQRVDLTAFRNLFKSLLNSAKNLKTLFCEADCIPYITRDLLQISPQLQTLHFRGEDEEEPFATEEMTALVNHHFPQLSALHVHNITLTNDNDDIFKSFLGNYADTLCSMRLRSNGDNFTFPPTGITLKRLEKLELSTFKGNILWENLPELKELDFLNTDVTSNNLHPSTLPSDWHVTKFKYDISWGRKPNLEAVYPSLAFPQFPLWFSKLCSLNLSFVGQQELIDVLPQIFHCCRQLKGLTIISRRSNEMDECITGISNSALAFLKGKCPASNESAASVPTSTENIIKMIEISKSTRSSAPNIGNLSELQEITLSGSFSDVAVLFGVIYCGKLRSLELASKKLTANAERIAKCGLPDMRNLSIERYSKLLT